MSNYHCHHHSLSVAVEGKVAKLERPHELGSFKDGVRT